MSWSYRYRTTVNQWQGTKDSTYGDVPQVNDNYVAGPTYWSYLEIDQKKMDRQMEYGAERQFKKGYIYINGFPDVDIRDRLHYLFTDEVYEILAIDWTLYETICRVRLAMGDS